MKQAFKEQWIEALRTYPKTKECLKDEKGFCCLGVALELIGTDWKPTGSTINGSGTYHAIPKDGHDYTAGGELNVEGRQRIRLSDRDHDELISLNDHNDTFAEVIEYIEALPADEGGYELSVYDPAEDGDWDWDNELDTSEFVEA